MLTLFNIFSAAEQMVAAILIARVSLSGTTERRFSCDLQKKLLVNRKWKMKLGQQETFRHFRKDSIS